MSSSYNNTNDVFDILGDTSQLKSYHSKPITSFIGPSSSLSALTLDELEDIMMNKRAPSSTSSSSPQTSKNEHALHTIAKAIARYTNKPAPPSPTSSTFQTQAVLQIPKPLKRRLHQDQPLFDIDKHDNVDMKVLDDPRYNMLMYAENFKDFEADVCSTPRIIQRDNNSKPESAASSNLDQLTTTIDESRLLTAFHAIRSSFLNEVTHHSTAIQTLQKLEQDLVLEIEVNHEQNKQMDIEVETTGVVEGFLNEVEEGVRVIKDEYDCDMERLYDLITTLKNTITTVTSSKLNNMFKNRRINEELTSKQLEVKTFNPLNANAVSDIVVVKGKIDTLNLGNKTQNELFNTGNEEYNDVECKLRTAQKMIDDLIMEIEGKEREGDEYEVRYHQLARRLSGLQMKLTSQSQSHTQTRSSLHRARPLHYLKASGGGSSIVEKIDYSSTSTSTSTSLPPVIGDSGVMEGRRGKHHGGKARAKTPFDVRKKLVGEFLDGSMVGSGKKITRSGSRSAAVEEKRKVKEGKEGKEGKVDWLGEVFIPKSQVKKVEYLPF